MKLNHAGWCVKYEAPSVGTFNGHQSIKSFEISKVFRGKRKKKEKKKKKRKAKGGNGTAFDFVELFTLRTLCIRF